MVREDFVGGSPLSTELKKVREGTLWRLEPLFLARETSTKVLEHWGNRMEVTVAGTECVTEGERRQDHMGFCEPNPHKSEDSHFYPK